MISPNRQLRETHLLWVAVCSGFPLVACPVCFSVEGLGHMLGLPSSSFMNRSSTFIPTLLFLCTMQRAASNLLFYQEIFKNKTRYLNGDHISIFRANETVGRGIMSWEKLQNWKTKQKHSLHMFGVLIKSMFTHCISYFPDAMINQHNQKQFKKGFILS